MRRLFVVALVLAAGVRSAQATTVTFEDLALDSFGTGGDRTSGGFFFDTALNHSHIDNGTGGWNTSDGTQFMMIDNVAVNPNGINNTTTFSPIGGGPFTLSSINISEAGGGGTALTGGAGCCSTYAHQVRVTGNLLGGGTVFRLLTLDYNGTTIPTFGFETFTFNSSWENLSSVVLEGIGADCCGQTDASKGNYFAIDNVVVNAVAVSAVPEPGTLTLLGLGSGYLIRRRQRDRR